MQKAIISVLLVLACSAGLWAQERGRIGIGYDEGLAARYFFGYKTGVQASLGFEHLGGYDNTSAGNLESEDNFSLGMGFLYNFFKSEHVNLDGLAQLVYFHDGVRDPDDVDGREWIFLRVAGAPEIFIGQHLGLGLRFGVELASMSGTHDRTGAGIVEVDDGVVNFRFFGPQNPFGGSTLGMALYVYFD